MAFRFSHHTVMRSIALGLAVGAGGAPRGLAPAAHYLAAMAHGQLRSESRAPAAQSYWQVSRHCCAVIAVGARRDRIGLLQYRISGRGFPLIGR
jgi:hypothetical protein